MNREVTQDDFELPEQYDFYLKARNALKDVDFESRMPNQYLITRIVGNEADKSTRSKAYGAILAASKLSHSKVRSSGRGRGAGYYFDPNPSSEDALDGDPANNPESATAKTLEKHLWPVVADWFANHKGFPNVSHQVANYKSYGKWSNPDVVALRPVDKLGFFDVEIATAEVKPSQQDWQHWIFEAVAHKRFSERSYFVFRVKSEGDIDPSMVDYAEKFGVGLVAMELDDGIYHSLSSNHLGKSTTESFSLIEAFKEIVPAPYVQVPPATKADYLDKGLKIAAKSDIFLWGR